MRTLLCSCQQGLIFRGHESGVDNNNVQLHTQELQSLLQDPKATEGLCTICSGYGLGILHLLECPASFEDPKKNPWLQPFDSRSQFQDDCPICKLLVSLLPEGSEAPWRICWVGYSQFKKPGYDGIWKVPVYVPPEEQREKKGDEMVEWKTQRTPVIVVAPEQEPEKWWEKRRNLYGMLLPTRKLGEDVLLPRARLLKTQSADLTLAKSWIGSCEEAHGDRCSGIQPAETGLWARFSSISFAARPSDTLRVIDCRTKTRVAAPAQCQYAALSYVFGTDRASIPNDIAKWDEVPVLFQDAVAATTQLGYHYLWIDFYCISDDDDDLKARQLRTMDKVYFEAQVCSDVVKAVIYTDAVYQHSGSYCLRMLGRRSHRTVRHKWESSSTVDRRYHRRLHTRSCPAGGSPVHEKEQMGDQRLDLSRSLAVPSSPIFHRARHVLPVRRRLRRRSLRHRDTGRPAPEPRSRSVHP
jgi:hypothetical protein